jgi:hypothetical protein
VKWLSLLAVVFTALPLEFLADEGANDLRPAAARNEALRQELRAMYEFDQYVRTSGLQKLQKVGVGPGQMPSLRDPNVLLALVKETFSMAMADDRNRRRLKEIIAQHGWPGKTLVGRDGTNAAWLIAQHSDLDREFQRRCLRLMEAATDGEVENQHIAYLTDRVLVGEKKPQRYGTQLGMNFEPQPIEDVQNVDKRRAEAGLPPLAQYVREAKEAYESVARGQMKFGKNDRE